MVIGHKHVVMNKGTFLTENINFLIVVFLISTSFVRVTLDRRMSLPHLMLRKTNRSKTYKTVNFKERVVLNKYIALGGKCSNFVQI